MTDQDWVIHSHQAVSSTFLGLVSALDDPAITLSVVVAHRCSVSKAPRVLQRLHDAFITTGGSSVGSSRSAIGPPPSSDVLKRAVSTIPPVSFGGVIEPPAQHEALRTLALDILTPVLPHNVAVVASHRVSTHLVALTRAITATISAAPQGGQGTKGKPAQLIPTPTHLASAVFAVAAAYAYGSWLRGEDAASTTAGGEPLPYRSLAISGCPVGITQRSMVSVPAAVQSSCAPLLPSAAALSTSVGEGAGVGGGAGLSRMDVDAVGADGDAGKGRLACLCAEGRDGGGVERLPVRPVGEESAHQSCTLGALVTSSPQLGVVFVPFGAGSGLAASSVRAVGGPSASAVAEAAHAAAVGSGLAEHDEGAEGDGCGRASGGGGDDDESEGEEGEGAVGPTAVGAGVVGEGDAVEHALAKASLVMWLGLCGAAAVPLASADRSSIADSASGSAAPCWLAHPHWMTRSIPLDVLTLCAQAAPKGVLPTPCPALHALCRLWQAAPPCVYTAVSNVTSGSAVRRWIETVGKGLDASGSVGPPGGVGGRPKPRSGKAVQSSSKGGPVALEEGRCVFPSAGNHAVPCCEVEFHPSSSSDPFNGKNAAQLPAAHAAGFAAAAHAVAPIFGFDHQCVSPSAVAGSVGHEKVSTLAAGLCPPHALEVGATTYFTHEAAVSSRRAPFSLPHDGVGVLSAATECAAVKAVAKQLAVALHATATFVLSQRGGTAGLPAGGVGETSAVELFAGSGTTHPPPCLRSVGAAVAAAAAAAAQRAVGYFLPQTVEREAASAVTDDGRVEDEVGDLYQDLVARTTVATGSPVAVRWVGQVDAGGVRERALLTTRHVVRGSPLITIPFALAVTASHAQEDEVCGDALRHLRARGMDEAVLVAYVALLRFCPEGTRIRRHDARCGWATAQRSVADATAAGVSGGGGRDSEGGAVADEGDYPNADALRLYVSSWPAVLPPRVAGLAVACGLAAAGECIGDWFNAEDADVVCGTVASSAAGGMFASAARTAVAAYPRLKAALAAAASRISANRTPAAAAAAEFLRNFSADHYLYARGLLDSRMFLIKVDATPTLCLLPTADMMNHSTLGGVVGGRRAMWVTLSPEERGLVASSTVADRTFEPAGGGGRVRCVVIRALVDVPPRVEVMMGYGALSVLHTAMFYGFVPSLTSSGDRAGTEGQAETSYSSTGGVGGSCELELVTTQVDNEQLQPPSHTATVDCPLPPLLLGALAAASGSAAAAGALAEQFGDAVFEQTNVELPPQFPSFAALQAAGGESVGGEAAALHTDFPTGHPSSLPSVGAVADVAQQMLRAVALVGTRMQSKTQSLQSHVCVLAMKGLIAPLEVEEE